MSKHEPSVKKVSVQPINLIFRFLQTQAKVSLWIKKSSNKRFEGIIVGFDEFMNLVLVEAEEINIRTNFRRKLGKILLRGNAVFLIQLAEPMDDHSLGSGDAKKVVEEKAAS